MKTIYQVSDIFFDREQINLRIIDSNTLKSFIIGLHDLRLNYLLSEIIPRDVTMIEHLRALDGGLSVGKAN